VPQLTPGPAAQLRTVRRWPAGKRGAASAAVRARTPGRADSVGGSCTPPDSRFPRELLHVVEVWRDISDRRAAGRNWRSRTGWRPLGRWLRFSHELNTPGWDGADVRGGLSCGDVGRRCRRGVDPHSASIVARADLALRGITQHFLRLSRGQRGRGKWWIWDGDRSGGAADRSRRSLAFGESGGAAGAGGDATCARTKRSWQHTQINLLLNAVQGIEGRAGR